MGEQDLIEGRLGPVALIGADLAGPEARFGDELGHGQQPVVRQHRLAQHPGVTRERLVATGTVVYLETNIETLVRRTKAAKTRPLLMNDDPRGVLERLMVTRRPLYEQTADLRVETTGRQVRAVAVDIQQRLAHRVAKPSST